LVNSSSSSASQLLQARVQSIKSNFDKTFNTGLLNGVACELYRSRVAGATSSRQPCQLAVLVGWLMHGLS
jgi:hypothetical protein